MHLEIVRHDGPGRLGKLHFGKGFVTTPSLFWSPLLGENTTDSFEIAPPGTGGNQRRIISYGSIFSKKKVEDFGILPSFPTGYDIPEGIVKDGLKETLSLSKKHPSMGVVLEGGRYVEMRLEAAKKFRDRPLIRIADADKLIRNHRKLVEVITNTREIVTPNTALYMSNIPPSFFSILVYMGVDLFDYKAAILGAHSGVYLTASDRFNSNSFVEAPCSCLVCEKYSPKELDFKMLLKHNINVTTASIKEVREAIRKARLRNLVEERSSTDVNYMGALRLLDNEKTGFLEKYTPIYPNLPKHES
jgi:archaeosine synthase